MEGTLKQGKHIYYGWWVVVGLFFSTFLGAWGRFILSTFAPAMTEETGWTTSQIMLSITIALVVYAIVLIFVGRLIDTWGGRRVITIGSICLMAGFALLPLIRELWQLYLIHGVLLTVAVAMLHSVPTQSVARKWFIKRATLVAGVLLASFTIAQAVLAPLLTQSAADIGWRTTCFICVSFGLIIFILARLVIKDTPESIGLQPYGAEESKSDGNEVGSNAAVEVSISPRQALHTRSFWALCTARGLSGIPIQGLAANIIVWGADITGDLATAGLFMTAFCAPGIFGGIMWGWMGDRFGKKKTGILSSVLCAVAMIIAWLWVSDALSLYIVCILLGVVFGGNLVVVTPYLGDLFGRASVGTLSGYTTAAHGLLGAIGPILWSSVFDATGRYNFAALISAGIYLLMVICFILVKPLKNTELSRI